MKRNINQSEVKNGTAVWEYFQNGVKTGTSSAPRMSDYYGYEHQTDDLPDYRAKAQSKAFLPTVPLWWAKSHHSCLVGSSRYDAGNGYVVTRSGYYDEWPLADYLYDESVVEDLRNSVSAALLEDVKALKVDLGTNIATAKQTVGLVADSAMKLAGAFRSLKRADFRSFAKYLDLPVSHKKVRQMNARLARNGSKEAAELWLMHSYGWSPTLSDVYTACEHLSSRIEARPAFKTSRKSRSGSVSDSGSLPSITDGNVGRYTRSTKYTVKGGVTFGSNGFKPFSEWGCTNPAVIMWELTPWSFVWDWFMPVGTWLGNLDATLGASFIGGYWVVVTEQQTFTSYLGGNPTYRVDVRGSKERKRISVQPMSGWPSNSFPRLKNPISTSHLQNATALLRTTFR